MDKIIPSYYSVIPAEVRYDNRLTDSEKLLYSEITALTQSSGECWATNEYFASLYEVSNSSISRRVSNLKRYGYIEVELVYKYGTKQIDKRIIRIAHTYTQNCTYPIRTNDNTPIRRIAKENTTSKSNTTSINNNTIVQNQDFTEQLNQFWNEYPRKENKKKSLEKLKQILKEEPELFEVIIHDVVNRKSSKQWKQNDGQYIPMPITYLNQRRWEDEGTNISKPKEEGFEYSEITRI